MDGMTMEEAEALNQAMVREFDGDPAATDSTRLLRLPGFANKKYEPDFYVQARTESTQTYHLREPSKFSASLCRRNDYENIAACVTYLADVTAQASLYRPSQLLPSLPAAQPVHPPSPKRCHSAIQTVRSRRPNIGLQPSLQPGRPCRHRQKLWLELDKEFCGPGIVNDVLTELVFTDNTFSRSAPKLRQIRRSSVHVSHCNWKSYPWASTILVYSAAF
jgi:hypothetical protein